MGASIDRQFHVMTRLLRTNYSALYRRIDRIADSPGHRQPPSTYADSDLWRSLPTRIAYLSKKLAVDLYVTKKRPLASTISRESGCCAQSTSKNSINGRRGCGRERRKNLRKSICSRSDKQERELWRTISC